MFATDFFINFAYNQFKSNMIKKLFYLTITFALASCSGSDDNSNIVNPRNPSIVGKWIITKAIYKNSTDTTYYSHSEGCGKEVLEFNSNNTVGETVYVDSDCQNGVGSEFDWWTSGNSFKVGYQNSDTTKTMFITNGILYFDGWEDWSVRKYYTKIN